MPALLDDHAMAEFIRDGYLTVRSAQPHDYHRRLLERLDELDEGGPFGHNNLLPCVPDLATLLGEPAVTGALTSILGPGYYLHFHRHDHFNFPGEAQPLHKDGDNHSHQAVDGLRRMHRTRFAMLFYYPQDTPLARGPTGIAPGSQYIPRRALEAGRRRMHDFEQASRRRIEARLGTAVNWNRPGSPADARARELLDRRLARFRDENPALVARLAELEAPWEAAWLPLTGDAGTVTIVHFDLLHGRCASGGSDDLRGSGRRRHMVKFLFTRDRDPAAPSWAHRRGARFDAAEPLAPLWESMWAWHVNARPGPHSSPGNGAGIESDDDRLALGAAYRLGLSAARGGAGLEPLLDAFASPDPGLRTIAAYGLVAAGAAAVPGLERLLDGAGAELGVRVLDVLGDIGAPAASALPLVAEAARHPDDAVRRYAAEAIGTVAQGHPRDANLLAAALADEDPLVRRNAALAAARLAPDLADANVLVPALRDNLGHWHHHVRGWSIEALARLATPAARSAALDYLMTARWDPMPKSGDVPPAARRPAALGRGT